MHFSRQWPERLTNGSFGELRDRCEEELPADELEELGFDRQGSSSSLLMSVNSISGAISQAPYSTCRLVFLAEINPGNY